MNWVNYSDKWIIVGNSYISSTHISDFVINKDNEECIVHMDNGRKYHINGLNNINKFMGYLFGDDD